MCQGGRLWGRAAGYGGCGRGICVKVEDVVVGKREAGVRWKIGEEIVEEVEQFKYLGVWWG